MVVFREYFCGEGMGCRLTGSNRSPKACFQRSQPHPLAVCSPCLVIVVEDVTSQILFLLLCTPTMHSPIIHVCARTHKHTLYSALSI